MNNKQHYDWIFLYWMPYDNNLSGFGIPIINMMANGVQSPNILVVVESDFWDAKHLSRSVITQEKIETQELAITNSASEEGFADYLHWAQSQFEANKWVIVFLGHGGRLDEVSPDAHPGGNLDGTQWMNIKKLSDAILNFNQKIKKRVELFFFQNCNKGTIEAHYLLHNTAKYTLSSPKILGAPNYYYEALFKFLGQNFKLDGLKLAEKVAEFEGIDMYSSYTVTNNLVFASLAEKLNPLIDSILSANFQAIKTNQITPYSYMEQQYVDAVSFFKTLTEQSGASKEKLQDFIDYFHHSVTHLPNPELRQQSLFGLGLFLPASRAQLAPYRYLPVYSDLKLVELFDAILFD